MKKILLSAFALLTFALANAQAVPNGNFETPIANGQLPGWIAIAGNISQTTSIQVNSQPYVSASGPKFLVMQNTTSVARIQTLKFPMASRPKTLRFLTTYLPATPATENFGILVLMTKKNGATTDTIFNSVFASTAGAKYPWVNFTIDLASNYKSVATPDSAIVQFITSLNTPTQGSTLLVDDVTFRDWGLDITGVENYFSQDLKVSPNPAASNSSINLSYQLNSNSEVSAEILDMQGRVVKTIAKESVTYGTFNKEISLEGLAAGVYVCRVTANNQVQTTKLVVGQ